MITPLDQQTLQDVLTGLSANALWSLVAHSGAKALAALDKRIIESRSANMFTEAAASVASEFAKTSGEQAQLRRFLLSPDVESIVRQMYAMKAVEHDGKHVGAIQEEFVLAFSKHLDVDVERARRAADAVFYALASECDVHFSAAVEANLLGAHESKSTARHRRLLGELAAIKQNLQLLTTADELNVEAVLRFEERYRAQVAGRHSHIQPPHLETARKYPLDELYVTPTLLSGSSDKHRDAPSFTLDQFMKRTHRTVVLGNPGGGKSTLALKLSHDLASGYDQRLINHRLLTPVPVILREYGGHKKTCQCSILQFIESQATSRYQLEPPPFAFEYLLLSGRVLVIFDGLDELLDTSYRREISGDLESFCQLYPSVPVIVTSREVGYEQAPLDPKQFRIYKIAPFDEAQVKDYTRKWFSLDDELSTEQCRQKADAFMRESALALDLRSNPLMLGLMCNLYRAEGYIPRNRPEIYEKCSLMLFERWDKGRGIIVALPFEVHIRPAMRHLAYWIYSQESLQGGVEHNRLIIETSRYLQQRVFDDRDEADAAASNFIDFCTGRAWVFTDTGTTSDGEKLYQFTHRTFLEYFSATYLFSVYPTPSDLLPVLVPRIAKQEWDVVAQLAFQIQSRNLEGAADKALSGLLERAVQLSREERWSVLLFAVRTLDSIVPSPSVRRAVVTAALRDLVSTSPVGSGRRDSAFGLIEALHAVSRDNRATVAETVEQVLKDIITSGGSSVREGASAFEFAYELPTPRFFHFDAPTQSTDWQNWSALSSALVEGQAEYLQRFARQELMLASTAFEHGHISITQLLQWHGTKGVFDTPYSRTLLVWWPPLSIRLLFRLQQSPVDETALVESDLAAVGNFLVTVAPPWTRRKSQTHGPDYRILGGELLRISDCDGMNGIDPKRLRSDGASFAVFAAVAVVLESLEEDKRKELVQGLVENKCNYLSASVRTSLVARFQQPSEPWECGLASPFKELVEAWVRHETSFVRQNGDLGEGTARQSDQLGFDVVPIERVGE